MVGKSVGQMGLVDDAENLVRSLQSERDKSTILNDEDLILRVANDCGLILRDLNDRQTAELDNGVGNYKKTMSAPVVEDI